MKDLSPAQRKRLRELKRQDRDLARQEFARYCVLAGLPEPVPELAFHPDRRWRFDWAWPDQRVALEIDGGVWSGGRHTRGAGFREDMEKLSEATARGLPRNALSRALVTRSYGRTANQMLSALSLPRFLGVTTMDERTDRSGALRTRIGKGVGSS